MLWVRIRIASSSFDAKILILDKNDSFVNLTIFSCFLLNRGYACA